MVRSAKAVSSTDPTGERCSQEEPCQTDPSIPTGKYDPHGVDNTNRGVYLPSKGLDHGIGDRLVYVMDIVQMSRCLL